MKNSFVLVLFLLISSVPIAVAEITTAESVHVEKKNAHKKKKAILSRLVLFGEGTVLGTMGLVSIGMVLRGLFRQFKDITTIPLSQCRPPDFDELNAAEQSAADWHTIILRTLSTVGVLGTTALVLGANYKLNVLQNAWQKLKKSID